MHKQRVAKYLKKYVKDFKSDQVGLPREKRAYRHSIEPQALFSVWLVALLCFALMMSLLGEACLPRESKQGRNFAQEGALSKTCHCHVGVTMGYCVEVTLDEENQTGEQ